MADTSTGNTIIERSQSSVVIKRDAKGVKSFEVKVYNEDPNKATEIALKQVEILEKEIDLED